jgi:hypothetical protein
LRQTAKDGLRLAFRGALAAKEPGNPLWQTDLASIAGRLARTLASRGKLSEALESDRESRAALERLTKNDPNNALWRGYLQRAIVRTGTLAYDFVKALDFATALLVADEARALYLRYRGEKVQGDMTWEALILGDFADLRKAGLTHPLMGEIETLFEGRRRRKSRIEPHAPLKVRSNHPFGQIAGTAGSRPLATFKLDPTAERQESTHCGHSRRRSKSGPWVVLGGHPIHKAPGQYAMCLMAQSVV